MKILVTGSRGQLGRRVVAAGITAGHDVITPPIDICKPIELPTCDLVINAAAYTAVDKAETERERAFAVNRDGAASLAQACGLHCVPFLHVSTDYVFDGTATRPYREDDPIAPFSAYGESKAAGERAVLDLGGTVVRTSWLFAEDGPSFVHTILRLSRRKSVMRIVADQRGCPTYGGDLAEALLMLATIKALPSLYHYCGDGETTWHGFATAILADLGSDIHIEPITTADYPLPARRPAYSVLDTTKLRALGIVPPPWHIGLARVIEHELLAG